HGNISKIPGITGTTHNVFGIKLGVGILVAVKHKRHIAKKIHYHRVPDLWRKEEKYRWLNEMASVARVPWNDLKPDNRGNWLQVMHAIEYSSLVPLATREGKKNRSSHGEWVFAKYSVGINSARDAWVYNFDRRSLVKSVSRLTETYNSEMDRWKRSKSPARIDNFVTNDPKLIKWSSRLKEVFVRGVRAEVNESNVRPSLFRPFSKPYIYFDNILNHRQAVFPEIFPTNRAELENVVVIIGQYGNKAFSVIVSHWIPDYNFFANPAQCFPFYTYEKDGTNRRENITDWALKQFREHYGDKKISKWDIFHYVYGLLHHLGYRERYADNLKRELPRLPFAPDFHSFADAGRKLAELHLNYEEMEPYELTFIESEGVPLSYHVEKMRLSKDKTQLVVNPSLTLAGIPAETFDYRLGNRSALDWVIDQYHIKEDKRSGIVSDPNRDDDPEYIVRLVGQVIRVSLETVKIVRSLPAEFC
ncbi:MAG: type ISP restriction/modification enzyme, partial [bacterium]